MEAQKITTKYSLKQIKKPTSKYQQLYDKPPQKINKKVFQDNDTSTLDSIIDRYNNILTNLENIVQEIYINSLLAMNPLSSHVTTSLITHNIAHVE
jgi:hypothetical protein